MFPAHFSNFEVFLLAQGEVLGLHPKPRCQVCFARPTQCQHSSSQYEHGRQRREHPSGKHASANRAARGEDDASQVSGAFATFLINLQQQRQLAFVYAAHIVDDKPLLADQKKSADFVSASPSNGGSMTECVSRDGISSGSINLAMPIFRIPQRRNILCMTQDLAMCFAKAKPRSLEKGDWPMR